MYILKYHAPIINIYYQNNRSYPSGPSGKIFRKEPMRITQRKLDKKLSMDGTKREDSTGVQDLGIPTRRAGSQPRRDFQRLEQFDHEI